MAVEVTEHLGVRREGPLDQENPSIPAFSGANRYIVAAVNYEAEPPVDTNGLSYGGQPMDRLGFTTVSNAGGTIRGDIRFFGIGEAGIEAASSNVFVPSFAGAAPTGILSAASMTGVNQANPFKPTTSDVGGDGNPGTDADFRSLVQEVDAGGAIFANVNLGLDGLPVTWVASFANKGPSRTPPGQTASYANAWDVFDTAGNITVTSATSGNNRGALLAVAINPAEDAPPSTGRITRLDDWELVAANQTSARNGTSFPISSGNNRLLVVTYSDLSDGNLPTAMRYGGQLMTQRVSNVVTSGRQIGLRLWTLGESGIRAALGSQIQATVPTTSNSEVDMFAASYQNTDQENLVVDTDSGMQGGGGPAVAMLKNFATTEGGIGIFQWANERGTTAPSATWIDGASEVFEVFGPLTYNSIAEATTTGQAVFPKVDPNSVHFRNVIIGITLRAAEATGNVVQTLAAEGAAVSTGTLENFVVLSEFEFGARGASSSAGSLRFIVTPPEPVGPNPVTIGPFRGESSSTGQFAFRQVASLSFLGTASSFGTVDLIGGSQTLRSPLDQEFTIADDFQRKERPVILVDLFFDEASVFIWTRPFEGMFEGNLYEPLAGITGSLSIRQSLDSTGFESSVQLTGLSPEIVAIGGTSQFQMRRANIRLGNIGDNGEIALAETLVPGRIQNITVVDDLEDPAVTIEIDSIFNDFRLPRSLRFSSSDQKRMHPGDTFFDFTESTRMQNPRFGG